MRIHLATPADAARLSQLACDTYREHFASIWHPPRLAAYLRSEFAPQALERALETDARDLSPLDSIAKAQSALGRFDQALETLYRKLERTVGEERAKLLLQIGDLAATRLKNPDYAAKSYLLALSEKPNDRDILAKLMQLYGAEKDWPQLIQVITNLLQNAIDSIHERQQTVPGEGRIRIVVELRGGNVIVTAEDNGTGLPEKIKEHILEPYVTTKKKGSGLGLAIVKKIMEDHGGSVVLEDNMQQDMKSGAKAVIVFPRDTQA